MFNMFDYTRSRKIGGFNIKLRGIMLSFKDTKFLEDFIFKIIQGLQRICQFLLRPVTRWHHLLFLPSLHSHNYFLLWEVGILDSKANIFLIGWLFSRTFKYRWLGLFRNTCFYDQMYIRLYHAHVPWGLFNPLISSYGQFNILFPLGLHPIAFKLLIICLSRKALTK